ncbi:unnamed protein product, partial [Mesorhabditis belari]|uniref:Alpha-1,3-glucosyltransferase n=1 Tax=Mesorhabditis belari TaxID=2138241 RepID=A0AAF3F472_9BILA
MLLQAKDDDSWFELPSVALCVEFTDARKFGVFITKIGNLPHYQQLILPPVDSEVDEDVEDENDFEDENDSDVQDHENSDEQIRTMNPRYSILEDYTHVNVTPGHIEIAVAGKTLRFAHPAANAPRRCTKGKNVDPRSNAWALLIPGVILQGKPQRAQQYLDMKKIPLKRGEFVQFDRKNNLPKDVRIRNDWEENLDDSGEIAWLEVAVVVCTLLAIQHGLATGGYSGFNKPPMFGDYEAQRHWMEITYYLPMKEWYIQSPNNDLLYWGLDYPPLTAYHSYLMGAIAHRINSSWVALGDSHGIETPEHKFFMRLTAIVSFLIIYVPAIVHSIYKDKSLTNKLIPLATLLLYPGLLAIDNAHFQYNAISLGFFLWSYLFLAKDKMPLGSIFFVLAVNYKQMELYHSLPIFVFILARSLKKPLLLRWKESFLELLKIGLLVIGLFALIWLPFLLQGPDHVLAVLRRVFPFSRGLYEDKVASFWCAFSPFIKLDRYLDREWQIRLSTLVVIAASLPSLLVLLVRPSPKNLRLSLVAVSLSFFLFSFQVHEKSILLPVGAALLLFMDMPFHISWFLTISSTSMYSLCLKDENPLLLCLFVAHTLTAFMFFQRGYGIFTWLAALSQLGAFAICLIEALIPPPSTLPERLMVENTNGNL